MAINAVRNLAGQALVKYIQASREQNLDPRHVRLDTLHRATSAAMSRMTSSPTHALTSCLLCLERAANHVCICAWEEGERKYQWRYRHIIYYNLFEGTFHAWCRQLGLLVPKGYQGENVGSWHVQQSYVEDG